MSPVFKKNILLIILFSLLISIILMCAVPPVSRDALTHHLAVPKLYIQNGNIYELPDITPSYYPQLIDLLYCLPMMAGNDIAPKYIHFLFALFTALIIFFYLKKISNSFYGLVAAIFFLSLPIIIKLSITVYVDLGLIFFSTAALLLLIKWFESQFQFRWLFAAATFCGLALSTKYNGLITCFLLTGFIPFIYLRGKRTEASLSNQKNIQLKAVGYAIGFVIISLVIFSPWMIKNYIWTKNPIYPLYNNFFNPQQQIDLTDENSNTPVNHFLIRKYIHKESWVETATIPLRIFFQGEDDNPQFFDGKLNPLLFFLPFFAFTYRKQAKTIEHRSKFILLLFSILYIVIVFFRQDMRIRWIGPVIPPLVILSTYGLKNILSFFEYVGEKRSKQIFLKLTKFIMFLLIFLTAGLNVVYIHQLFQKVSPLPYINGKISRSEYIKKFRPEYAALEFANQNLGDETKILAFFLGNRIYYSNHDIKFNYSILKTLAKDSKTPEDILKGFKRRNFTTLIINYQQFNNWVNKEFGNDEKKKIQGFFNLYTKKAFTGNGHGVYPIISG